MSLRLHELTLRHFRNYREASFRLGAQTVIVGPNATGKTNLLEAAYLFSAGKSFRAGRESEMVAWGESQARVEATFEESEGIRRAALTLDASGRVIKKTFSLDGKARPTKELRRRFPMVLFSSDDIRLVDGSPGRRRRSLDLLLSQGSPAYADALSRYNRALASRNRLLERIAAGEAGTTELDAWDEQLAEAGAAVWEARSVFVGAITTSLGAAYDALTERSPHARGTLGLAYDAPGGLAELLVLRRGQDLAVGTTTAGPHRDDWQLLLRGRALSSFGSSGEFRSASLALRLAECAWLREMTGREPILLLDDVFSELDADRSESLRQSLPEGQTLITTPEERDVPESLREGAELIRMTPKQNPTRQETPDV